MNVFDLIFIGWYQIFVKTIYSNGGKQGFGPKEHALFITFLFHGINLWTFLRYLLIELWRQDITLISSLFLFMVMFSTGYLVYYKGNRAEKIILFKLGGIKFFFFIIIAIIYVLISLYLMLKVGDYVRLINMEGR